MVLKIEVTDPEIKLPAYMHETDAALDLPSRENLILKPQEKKIIKTGIKMAIPKGHAGLIWDRSGLAAKHSLHCLAGVIDSGFRGEIGVVITNLSDKDFEVEKGMRIAQILIQPVTQFPIQQVKSLDEDSDRNLNAFGSTGLYQ